MRITKRTLAIIIALAVGLTILFATSSAREDIDGLYADVELEELIGVGGISLVDITVHSTNVEGASLFSVEEYEDAGIGERLTFATYEESFTLYFKDDVGTKIEAVVLPVGDYRENVDLEDPLEAPPSR